MTNEPTDGFLLLTLVDVHAQQMGAPGFMLRDDQLRTVWQSNQDQPDHPCIFLEQLHQRVQSIRKWSNLPEGDPLLPVIDSANCLVTFRIGSTTLRVNLLRNCIELMSGPIDELPQYIRFFIQPVQVCE